MKCGICGSDDTAVIYDDVVRNGGIGKYTDEKYQMYQCQACGTIFHKLDEAKSDAYYQSTEYRLEMNETADVDGYDRLHDGEVLEKLEYTGTDIYRNKIVADIGCGGGSFLDFVAGAAKEIVAIEPSASFRKALSAKGYRAYPYASDAMHDFAGKIDVVTSFDVIEHVNDPAEFMKDVHALLSKENNRPGGGGHHRHAVGLPFHADASRKSIRATSAFQLPAPVDTFGEELGALLPESGIYRCAYRDKAKI